MKTKKKLMERQPLNPGKIDTEIGLTPGQVQERVEKGHINNVKIGTSRSVWNIIFTNTFTFFNVLCFLIFAWILTISESFDDFTNCTFMLIIVVNILIGTIQELKAKKTVDKLSLLTAPKIKVLRDGEIYEIEVNQLLRDDVMVLSSGKQVVSDSEVVDGEAEVNESMLTGESKPMRKKCGDTLFAGSYIVTGKCRAQVRNIAEENYIQQLAIEAKKYKREPSVLMRTLRFLMKVLTIIILIVAVPSFLSNLSTKLNEIQTFDGLFAPLFHLGAYTSAQIFEAYRQSVMPTSAALIGMIPAGLFLMTSVALSVGVIRLGKKNALVQGLYSIETLARVDMLCLDKTGTITDGTMKVVDVIPLGKAGLDKISDVVASMQAALEDNNQTALALRQRFGTLGSLTKQFAIPFSSERKCSAMKFTDESFYVLGAPEYVCKGMKTSLTEQIDGFARQGARCLLLAECTNVKAKEKAEIPETSSPLALIIIEDNIKSQAAETIQYFRDNGVDVRVISGDNPITVSHIARRVGIANSDQYVSLQGMSDQEIRTIALNYTVFGRVSPEQKKLLVTIFKAAGHTVAMTGDGINDILALKEADCSIAMANGSEATRNVAQLVLMDSNFASMPHVVGEGRRVVNNIERASTLFLMKTAFSFLVQIVMIFMQQTFPMSPVQLSFISFFTIGAPALFLALEPNNNRIQGNFLVNIAKKVLPAGLAILINVIMVFIFAVYNLDGGTKPYIQMTPEQISTLIMLTVYSVFLLVLYTTCKPFTPSRIIMLIAVFSISLLIIVLSPLVPNQKLNFFKIAALDNLNMYTLLVTLLCISYFFIRLCRFMMDKYERFRLKQKKLKEAETE